MRKGRDGEMVVENNGENSGPLTSLPVDRLNGDRLQRRPLVPINATVLAKAIQSEWLF